ncbi:hypothetical protein DFH11DRAFT_1545450 [Phellopilus nigrolimitatus]|nr:hypothetical protein DFH11DRAFT_1545450 [Phellopilus nigrolimitatus]
MRLFFQPSSVSPFCTCTAHALPPSSPETERLWQSIPGGATPSPLISPSELRDDMHDDLPIFSVHDMRLRISSDSLMPSSWSKDGLSEPLSASSESSGAGWSDGGWSTSDSAGASAGTGATTPSPGRSSFLSLSDSECEDAPDALRAAHFVYRRALDSADAAGPEALLRSVGEAMRMVPDVSAALLRATLRSVAVRSFKEMWKERSALWHAIERAAHPHPSCLPSEDGSYGAYGAPALQLAAFAGTLFALDVLGARDLQACIGCVRGAPAPARLALHALRALVECAGDKMCRSKNRAYADALCAELAARVWDQDAQLVVLQIRDTIARYFEVQTGGSDQVATSKNNPRILVVFYALRGGSQTETTKS